MTFPLSTSPREWWRTSVRVPFAVSTPAIVVAVSIPVMLTIADTIMAAIISIAMYFNGIPSIVRSFLQALPERLIRLL